MNWLFDLHKTQPIAHTVGMLAFVCVLGIALGSLKFRGIGLGTSGVLFAGILVGHFREAVDHQMLDFVKEFGLILFVFTIGLQLGPGFFAALRQQGVKMNALAAAIVILGAVGAPLIGWFGELNLDDRFGVAVTRITRADLEMSAVPGLQLQFGDQVQIVGIPADLDEAAAAVGNSLKELNDTHFIPFFIDLSGLLAGSMTNPPGLAFATNIAGSDAPTVAYATVYPLTTLLRILSAQVLVILLFR